MMNSQAKFQKLLEPGRIGKMELRNRIVMPPMATGYADENGFVTERLKDYCEARAKGGVRLFIVELCCVDTSVGRGFTHQMAIDDDKYIPGLSSSLFNFHSTPEG
jgi:2,4-dienoyl-CoA reductase-like NADH-dependent reductase (Old Yellow Enzyme family)